MIINQKLNNLLKDPRTNWKYIWIVVVAGFIAGTVILGYYYLWLQDLEAKLAGLEERLPKVKPQEEVAFVYVYPDDYILRSNEVPSGFELELLSGEDIESGYITGNPGFIDNEFYRKTFERADPSKIEKFYVSAYFKPEKPETELGVYVIKYKSDRNFDSELEKIKMNLSEDIIYLKNKDILVMVWSDLGTYMQEVTQIADKLRARLNLQEI